MSGIYCLLKENKSIFDAADSMCGKRANVLIE